MRGDTAVPLASRSASWASPRDRRPAWPRPPWLQPWAARGDRLADTVAEVLVEQLDGHGAGQVPYTPRSWSRTTLPCSSPTTLSVPKTSSMA